MAETAAERTRQAIEAINAGDVQGGRALLAEALRIDPEYELAWLWFAAVARDDGEKKFCLSKAREVNPLHEANAALTPLKGVEATAPPELGAIVDPDPPEFVQDYVPELLRARRKRRLRGAAITIAVLAALAGLLWLITRQPEQPVKLAAVVNAADDIESKQIMDTIDMAVTDWNSSGKQGNHPLQIDIFYDEGDATKAAEVAQQIVDTDEYVGVIGHITSTTSLAASPIYQAAKLPAITASATADGLTAGNPYYFRTVFNNSGQGEGIAAYVAKVLNRSQAIVISTDDAYGESLRDGFIAAYEANGNKVQKELVIPADDQASPDTLNDIVSKVQFIEKPGPFVLLVTDPKISRLARALEVAGLRPLLVGSDALATPDFFRPMAFKGGARTVNRSIAASPLTRGAMTGEAVQYATRFSQTYGYQPTWVGPLTYDAVNAFAQSAEPASLTFENLAADREVIRLRLDDARSPDTSLQGLTGSIYFDASDSMERPVGMEDGRIAPNGRLRIESAPVQLAPYSPSAGYSAEDEISAGNAVRFNGTVYTLQQIVAVGVNYNEVNELDVAGQTYFADFFIWFKYGDGAKGVADVVFPNAVGSVALGDPERLDSDFGQTYALYRVTGEFKGQFNFRQFPFDTQSLPVYMQNRRLSAAKISYSPDWDMMSQTQAERLESGVDAGSTIDNIPNWEATSVLFYPMSVGNTSSLGDPYAVAGTEGVTYSQFAAVVDIQRDVTSFLAKNLLPLILLTIVVYISLWLPFKDHAPRVNLAVTGILTGAVMLNTVTSSLPSVDYTVAIEWAYYAFIFLAATTVLITLAGRHLNESRKLAAMNTLNIAARIYYPVFVFSVAFIYWWNFH